MICNEPDGIHRIIYEPMCEGHQVEFLYSIEERRELVRRVLIKLCKEWIYPADAWKEVECAAMSQIEGVIKEQGL